MNFSLDTVCAALTVLSGFCDEDRFAPSYMQALLEAIVEQDVRVRAIAEFLTEYNIIAIRVLVGAAGRASVAARLVANLLVRGRGQRLV